MILARPPAVRGRTGSSCALTPILRAWAARGDDSLASIERADIIDALPELFDLSVDAAIRYAMTLHATEPAIRESSIGRYRQTMATGSARYDDVADFYISGQPETFDLEMDIALFDLVGAADGARVLDLACGHGRIARELARRGAHVVGVDLANELITRAQQVEQADPLGIDYIVDDAASPHLLGGNGNSFDVIVSNFGLSDIDDLDGTLRNVHRLLVPGGRFVFLILHPCFPGRGPAVAAAWPPDVGYYMEGFWITAAPNSRLRQLVGANHRMLSTYINRLLDVGFIIDRLAEPRPPDAWNAATPDLDPVPTILIVRAVKQQA